MTFIPKPDLKPRFRDSFKPIRPAFRERQYGSEFNKWELSLLKEFSSAKASRNPVISGSVVYDKALGRGRFLLIPATHLPQDYAICECAPGIPIPANLSYVTITGRKKVFYDYWEIIVDNISYEKPRLSIRPEIDFKDFQDELFLQWGGISSPLRELLAFEFVSSPPLPDLGQVGGLNITLYDGTSRGESKRLLKYFKSMIPLDMALGKSGNLAIPELAAEQPLSPFSWQFRSYDADKPLNQHLTVFLERRRSRRFSEISVGLGSRRNQPESIYEPPMTKVDQPTLLPDNVEKLKMCFDPPLEVTKYIITMQMMFPTIGRTRDDLDKTLELASRKIVNIAEKHDLPHAVRRHGLFDPNYYGKPQSILRLALASARSEARQTTNDELIMKVFDEIYLKNVENIMEAWEDIMTPKGVELVSLNDFDKQVLKFITEKEGKDYGVGFSALNERFIDEVKLRLALDRLDNIGKIYMVRHDVYRSIPFVD